MDNEASNLPTIFVNRKNKRFVFVSPEKFSRKKKVQSNCRPTGSVEISASEDLNRAEYGANTRTIGIQTEHTFSPAFYEAEKYFLEKEINFLKHTNSRLTTHSFGFFRIQNDTEACLHYTGLQLDMLCVINEICSKICPENKIAVLTFPDQVLLTLMKLRLNSAYIDLSRRFGVSKTTVFRIINTVLYILHAVLYKGLMKEIPSQKKNMLSLPACFQSFQNCRIILDCTEVECDIPHSMLHQKLTYSSYKGRNTLKALIGIAPNCTLTYCSNLYPGSTSDKAIVEHCGIINQFEPGDLIIADKGFLISDLLPQGVYLNIPPFLSTPQFTPNQVYETRRIAKSRIHVERVINRLKRYQIVRHVPKSLFCKASIIIQTCAALVNFQTPALKEVQSHFNLEEEQENDDLNEESD